MSLLQLTKTLTRFGTIQVLKEGVVFSLLLTGKGLTDSRKVFEITGVVTDYCNSRFNIIEVMKNEDDFIIMILRP